MSLPDVVTESAMPALELVTPSAVLTLLEPKLTSAKDALIKIVTDLVDKKPSTPEEALKLLATLQGKIAEWVVSELPEKDKILAGLKMAETVAASVGCLPCFRK